MGLQSFLGFGVAVLAQVVSLSRLVLTFPRLVAVISNRAYALVRHSPLLTGSTDAGAPLETRPQRENRHAPCTIIAFGLGHSGLIRRSNARFCPRSNRTKLASARSALRPLARQGHLVGTVSGPVPVGRPPQPQAWRPSILTEPYRELPPPHSITSSARASSDAGTSRPSALAVLRLMTSSYLVGACTGRSAGFSPFRIRST